MVRTFIAIDFDDEHIRKNVKKLQDELKITNAGLKFVDPKIIHITLEFLGEISDKQVEEIINCLQTIVFEPFEIKLKGLAVLPNEKYVRVIYSPAYCTKEGYLTRIQQELHKKLEEIGFKLEKRPFKAHLTIARVKNARNKQALLGVIRKFSSVEIGSQKIRKIKLKKSVLTPQGPNYSTLFEVEAKE